MTNKQAVGVIKFEIACVNRQDTPQCTRDCKKCDLCLPTEDVLQAYEMAIKALSQEPCDVSVSEKEPNEITEEVTLRFFKNTLKVRWHDFVIYNVEWLKKHWQMEMDIVCGVKPCDDAISREAVLDEIEKWIVIELQYTNATPRLIKRINELPPVTQKSGVEPQESEG